MSFLIHLTYLVPLLAGIGILLGVPARRTAIAASIVALISAAIVFVSYNRGAGGYQFAGTLFDIVGAPVRLAVGVDGLNATMLLLTSIVAVAANWIAPKVEDGENRYYACVLFIAAGAAGAFASLVLFFFLVS